MDKFSWPPFPGCKGCRGATWAWTPIYRRGLASHHIVAHFCLFPAQWDRPDVLRLWEVLWTQRPTGQFVTWLAAAAVIAKRDVILGQQLDFGGVMMLFMARRREGSGEVCPIATLPSFVVG